MTFSLLTADQISPGLLGGPQWGIFYPNGQPVIVGDSVNDLDYLRMYQVSDAPQEKGAFESYNKVQVPYDAKVGYLTNQTRLQLMNALEPVAASLDLVTVVSPEVTYQSANIVGYGFHRSGSKGKTLIAVIVYVKEVRIIVGVSPTAPQSTNAATPTMSGQVQTVPAGGTTFAGAGNTTFGSATATEAGNIAAAAPIAGAPPTPLNPPIDSSTYFTGPF